MYYRDLETNAKFMREHNETQKAIAAKRRSKKK